MFDAKITTKLDPSIWGQGALVQTGMMDYARAPGEKGPISLSAYDVGAWCLYQATTSQALMTQPGAGLEAVAQQLLTQQAVTIDTTKDSPAGFARFPGTIPAEIRKAVQASNHVIRLALRDAVLLGPRALGPAPSGEAFAGSAFVVPVGAPLVIAATIVGVAAIGGGAWYAVEAKKVEAGLSAHVAELSEQVEMYKASVAAAVQTQQPIPAPPAVVQRAAKEEEDRALWLIGGGLAVFGAGALAAYLVPKTIRRRTARALPARRNPSRRRKTTRRKTAPKKRATKKRATKRAPAKRRPNPKRKTAPKKRATKRAPAKRRRAYPKPRRPKGQTRRR